MHDAFEPPSAAVAATPLAAQIAQMTAQAPCAVAVQAGDDSLTYAELSRRANRLGRHLQALGVGPNQLVAIHLPRSIDQVIACLAVINAGGCFLPMDPAWPASRIGHVLDDSGALAVIGRGPTVAALRSQRPHIVDLSHDAAAIAGREPDDLGVRAAADDLAYVIYTSGSTGGPKGVEITWRSFLHFIAWRLAGFGHAAGERVSQIAGVAFDASLTEIWPTLASGGTVVLVDDDARASPDALKAWLVAERISIAPFVPPALAERMIVTPWPAGAALRRMMSAGEALHAHPTPGLPFVLHNGYGPTECTIETTLAVIEPKAPGAARPPIGRPIPGTAVYLLDEAGRPTPDGQIGEIFVGGANVGRGYRNRPELTATRFVPDPFAAEPGARMYRTGDLGARLPDGQLAFHGRTDDQVQVRGHRVEPGEVEAALSAHPQVASCVVVARETASGAQLVAYVVLAPGAAPTVPVLREFLGRRLPDYMFPAAYVHLDRLPMTPNGKVDKVALPKPQPDNTLRAAAFRPPASELERDLVGLWEEVLGRSGISVDDNFFDLGGHSILVARLVRELEDRYARKLGMAAVFDAPTVSRMAAFLEEHRSHSRVLRIQPHGSRPQLFWLDAGPYFRPLSDALGPDQPFLGIHLDEDDERELGRDFTVADVAARMAEAIVAAQPEGPYFLGGFCDWGIVAHCAARQLMDAGQEIGLLCMIHPQYPPAFRAYSALDLELSRVKQHMEKIVRLGLGKGLLYALQHSGSALKRYVTETARAASEPDFRERLMLVCNAYDPGRYPGAVLLVQPQERPGVMEHGSSWASVTDGAFEEYETPGEHLTMLLPPNVQSVGAVLGRTIERLAPAAPRQRERAIHIS